MWKDWEFIQAAMEDIHYSEESGGKTSPEEKMSVLTIWAKWFAQSENPYVGKDAAETLEVWLKENRQGVKEWIAG